MRRSIRLLLLAGCLALLLPVGAGAQEESSRTAEFCGRQAARQQGVRDGFEERKRAYDEAVKRQEENQLSRRKKFADELAKTRSEADKRRELSLKLMEFGQSTEEARALAQAYAKDVNEAIATRRSAYDRAIEAFQRAVDDQLAERDEAIRNAVEDFRRTAGSAMDVALSSCNSVRGDRSAARLKLIEDLRSARVSYGDTLRSRPDFRQAVRAAAKERDALFKTATAEFQQSMQQLREKYPTLR